MTSVPPKLIARLQQAYAVDRKACAAQVNGHGIDGVPERARALDTAEAIAEAAPHLPRGGVARQVLAELLEKGEQIELPLPTRLHIELTNRCNSRCRTCRRTIDPEPPQDLSLKDVKRAVLGLPDLRSVALQVNGEPLLYPHLAQVLRLLRRYSVATELNTNGIALRRRRAEILVEEGLDALHVSLDAATPETYLRIRGVDAFERVLGNVERFLHMRGPWPAAPKVTLWMTATRDNLGELPGLVEIAGSVGADAVMLQRLVLFGEGLATEQHSLHARLGRRQEQAIAEASALAERLGVQMRTCGGHTLTGMLRTPSDPEPWRSCRRPWESAAVLSNGDVVPCCISTFTGAREEIVMGNLRRADWPEIWRGPTYDAHRASLLAGEAPTPCQGCGTRWSL